LRPPGVSSNGKRFRGAFSGRFSDALIAEIKHRSPSAGVILPDPSSKISRVAAAYRRGGAVALSVVIEQDFFGGDPAWLPEAKRASGLPVLMKDFVVSESQLDFALGLGADAVLLIVAALPGAELPRLHAGAKSRGLAVLVEAHDEDEVRRALAAGAEIVGINARDLRTFQVDLGGVAKLAALLPADVVRVAESGVKTRQDVEKLVGAGFGAFLVGESLLTSGDEARAVRELRGVNATEVKVCGVTREEDVDACIGCGVDYIGLNFSPRSPRRVTPETGEILRKRGTGAKGIVAVFSENQDTEIREVAERLQPDILQLTDPPSLSLSKKTSGGLPLWQTVRVGRDDLMSAAEWPGDALLFDTAVNGVSGGTGTIFEWSLLDTVDRSRPLVLAGGLRPSNVAEAIRRVRPSIVDVASGVEVSPGIKDPEKIASFVEEVRRA